MRGSAVFWQFFQKLFYGISLFLFEIKYVLCQFFFSIKNTIYEKIFTDFVILRIFWHGDGAT